MSGISCFKKIIVLLLAAALLVSTVGCGPAQNNSSPAQDPGSNDTPVKTEARDFSYTPPVTRTPASFYTQNNIEIKYDINNQSDGWMAVIPGSFRIEGLKDTKVAGIINDAVNAKLTELSDPAFVPDVTGIKIIEKRNEGRKKNVALSFDYDLNASFENIISVTISYTMRYGGNYDDYIRVTTALNFDLATGKQLSLQDLFMDGVDAEKYVNAALAARIETSDPSREPGSDMEYFMYSDRFPAVIRPFGGIREDQQFYISSNGALNIILDSRNPEFFLGRETYSTAIDISKVSAIDTRFGGDKGLYTSDEKRRSLTWREVPGQFFIDSSEYFDEEDREKLGWPEIYLYRYSLLTDEQNSFLSMEKMDLKKLLRDTAAGSKGSTYVAVSSHAQYCGGCLNLSASYHAEDYSIGTVSRDQEQYTWAQCIKEGTERPLDIGEIFIPGTDWKDVLRKAILKSAVSEEYYIREVDMSDPALLAHLEYFLDNLNGFCLGDRSLELSCGDWSFLNDLGQEKRYVFQRILRYIDYSFIGFDVLLPFTR